jgi:hypothetical protein
MPIVGTLFPHMIAQHQLFGVRMEVDLFVDAIGDPIAVMANRSYKSRAQTTVSAEGSAGFDKPNPEPKLCD